MIEIINNTELVKARKEHTCSFCHGIIAKGSEYERTVCKQDGDIYTWKAHLHCQELIKICKTEACDEGITDEDFYEGIREFMQYEMSIGEIAKMLYGYIQDNEKENRG